MKRFVYQACDAVGATRRGAVWAREIADAKRSLAAQGLMPLRLDMAAATNVRLAGSREARLGVLRSLASQTAAGVSVKRALASTEALSLGRVVLGAVRDCARLVADGESLGLALERTGVIASSTASIIKTGERSGDLAQAIDYALQQLEYESAIVSRIRAAMAYPAILLATAMISFGLIGFIVLPRFAEVVRALGAEPPAFAGVILRGAMQAREHIVFLVCIVAVVVAALGGFLRRPVFREILILRVDRIPIVGRIYVLWRSVLDARALGTMTCAGMPLNRALAATAEAAVGRGSHDKLRLALDMVNNGEALSHALAVTAVVPDRVTPILEIGERTAALGETLLRVAAQLEREATEAFDRAIALLQPVIVLIFGALIASLAGLVLQTLYSVRPALL